jgi:hypothetical protein
MAEESGSIPGKGMEFFSSSERPDTLWRIVGTGGISAGI